MRKLLIIPALLAALAVGACGGSDLSTEDAHDTATRCRPATDNGACLDDSQKRTVAFPNHFANLATACDGYGHRIWETTRSQTWIYPDPSCPGYTERTPDGFALVQSGR